MFHQESPKMAPVLINKLDSVLSGLLDIECYMYSKMVSFLDFL